MLKLRWVRPWYRLPAPFHGLTLLRIAEIIYQDIRGMYSVAASRPRFASYDSPPVDHYHLDHVLCNSKGWAASYLYIPSHTEREL